LQDSNVRDARGHSNHFNPLNLVDQSQEAAAVVLAVCGVRWVTFGGATAHSERGRADGCDLTGSPARR